MAGAVGCGSSDAPPAGPEPPAGLEPRTYAMGWTPNPPRPSEVLFVETTERVAEVADVVLLQEPVPWSRLLAGEPMDDLVEEKGEVADYFRALGLELVWLVDPLDGLDRRKETPALVEAGRSLREPDIRAMHAEWVRRLAERTEPRWFGLASEVNTLAARGEPVLWETVRDLVNDLAPDVRAASPGSRVFVSFQVDDAWNRFGLPSRVDHFALADSFDVDLLGLSTYPVFVFDAPAEIPDDYFSRFRETTDLPLALVEGGWASEDSDVFEADPEEQVAFFRRMEELLDGVDAELWVFLLFADLDVPSLGLPPDRAEALARFSRMGVVDTELVPKPAHATWVEIFERPLP